MSKSFKSAFATTSIASLALVALLGTTASATPLKWTKLTLINGWTFYSAYTRIPTAAIDADGIVHLRGAMREVSGTDPTAFVLPGKMRPNKSVYVVTNLDNGAIGQLWIDPDGNVNADAPGPFSAAQGFTSLEGVTFSKY
jgi:hypothetical protein